MKELVASYSKLVDYKVADVTAASTYYLAEIYYNFSRSLLASERPEGLSALELEEFNLALDDQAFPFEEKAITVHEKNVELLTIGVYSPWIDRSIEKLAKLVPARFAKYEERLAYIDDIDFYQYSSPRFVREDAATVVVEHIDFFRYASQISQNNAQEGVQNAEIVIQDDLKTNGIGVTAIEEKEASKQSITKQSITEKPRETPEENSLPGAQTPAATQIQPAPDSEKVMATQSPQSSAPDASAGVREDTTGQANKQAVPDAVTNAGVVAEEQPAKQTTSESQGTKGQRESQEKQNAGTAPPNAVVETPTDGDEKPPAEKPEESAPPENRESNTDSQVKGADSQGTEANSNNKSPAEPQAPVKDVIEVKDIKEAPSSQDGAVIQEKINTDSKTQEEQAATNGVVEKQQSDAGLIPGGNVPSGNIPGGK